MIAHSGDGGTKWRRRWWRYDAKVCIKTCPLLENGGVRKV